MSDSEQHQIVVYVGTGKLVGLVGQIDGEDPQILRCKIIRDPEGFQGGLVTHMDKATTSLQNLLEELLQEKELEDVECQVVLGNSKLKTYQFSSSQYYQGNQRTISPYEIRAVISQTRSVATLPLSEIVLQAIPESFLVNDLHEIRNPLGLEAQRLGVNLEIFTMNFQDFKNIQKVFENLEINVQGFFPKTLTLSEAILNDQEKNEGVLVFDIAEDVTHLVLWKNGYLASTKVLDVGGSFVTQKISDHWQIDPHDARKAKEQYGVLSGSGGFSDEIIPLVERNGQGSRQIKRHDFEQSFSAIGKEWLSQILKQAEDFATDHQVRYPHFIFTGGGTRIDGVLEFLQKEFSRSARIGLTRKVNAPNELLVDPSLTACLGMYRWLATQEKEHQKLLAPRGIVEKTLSSARSWFAAYF